MDDDWDNIILHRDSRARAVKNIGIPSDITEELSPDIPEKVAEEVSKEIPKEVSEERPRQVLKELLANVSQKSTPKASDVSLFLPKIQKTEKNKTERATAILLKKAISPYISPSPYGPRTPALWSAEWANKFATLSLALVISFGIYTYSGYIADLGLKRVASATADSFVYNAEKLRGLLTVISKDEDGTGKSQMAVPVAAVLKI